MRGRRPGLSAADGALGAQSLEQHVGSFHLESLLAERQLDVLGLYIEQAVALPAAEMVVRRDVRIELAGPWALDDAEEPDLGELAERVVDGGSRQLGELGARLLEHLLGAQVTVRGAREQAVDRTPLGGRSQAVRAQQLGQ